MIAIIAASPDVITDERYFFSIPIFIKKFITLELGLGALDKKTIFFEFFFKFSITSIAFELNFGEDTPLAKKYGEAYNELSLEDQQKLTDEVVNDVVPQIAKDIGLKVNTMSSNTIGGWGDSISANSTTRA